MDNFAENIRDKSPPVTDPEALAVALSNVGTMSPRLRKLYDDAAALLRAQAAWLAAQPQQPAPEPVARVPLTEEQVWADDAIMECNAHIGAQMYLLVALVRAVERAHGISTPQTPATPGDTEGRA